jgi:uncharacterized protein YhbP (UPF0306 family)
MSAVQQVRHILDAVTTMTLATAGKDAPHAAPVYFAADENLSLYFFSNLQSRHIQQVVRNQPAAAAIYPLSEGWRDIHGLQLHGEVHPVKSPETWHRAWQLYQRKFPFVRALRNIIASSQMYVFLPGWIRLVDNSKGFGFKQEYDISELIGCPSADSQ